MYTELKILYQARCNSPGPGGQSLYDSLVNVTICRFDFGQTITLIRMSRQTAVRRKKESNMAGRLPYSLPRTSIAVQTAQNQSESESCLLKSAALIVLVCIEKHVPFEVLKIKRKNLFPDSLFSDLGSWRSSANYIQPCSEQEQHNKVLF